LSVRGGGILTQIFEKIVLITTKTALGSLSKILLGDSDIHDKVIKKNAVTGTRGLIASLNDLM
jgi:hypothetical protein